MGSFFTPLYNYLHKWKYQITRASITSVMLSCVTVVLTFSTRQACTQSSILMVPYHPLASQLRKVSQMTQMKRTFTLPVHGIVTSPFGSRWGRLHAGVDIANSIGTPIYPASGGFIIRSGWFGGYGYSVDIRHFNGYLTRYGHMSKLEAPIGKFVSRNDKIGLMGSTGHSTGPHLHFEIRNHYNVPIDPKSFEPELNVGDSV